MIFAGYCCEDEKYKKRAASKNLAISKTELENFLLN